VLVRVPQSVLNERDGTDDVSPDIGEEYDLKMIVRFAFARGYTDYIEGIEE
jgi:hypothetical protein